MISRSSGRRYRVPLVLTVSTLLAALLIVATPTGANSSTTSSPTTTSTTTTSTTSVPPGVTTTTTTVPVKVKHLLWPAQGSAAAVIPQLSVFEASPEQSEVPIASLTKMMTAWVVLHKLPLRANAEGPCLTVTPADVTMYWNDIDIEQSVVAIATGEQLCEGQLLRGLFVHSAADYAQLLVALTGMTQGAFVRQMNADAKALGLSDTHYVEETGINPGNRSTAEDQAELVMDLIDAEPIVPVIARLTHVSLPVAGSVGSYTPYIGEYGVIGIKSGFTSQAGGCDVMARKVEVDGQSVLTYVVVLGQHANPTQDPLVLAGNAALNLSRSLITAITAVSTPDGKVLEWAGPPNNVTTTTTTVPTTTTTTTPPTTTTTVVPTTTTSTSTTTTTTATTTTTTTLTP